MDLVLAKGCEIRRHDQYVVLVLETADDHPEVAAVLSPREARHIVSRMGKAANDAASAASRMREAA